MSDDFLLAIVFRQQAYDLERTFESLSSALHAADPAVARALLARLKIVVFDNGSRPDVLPALELFLAKERSLLAPFSLELLRSPLPRPRGEVLTQLFERAGRSTFLWNLEAGFRVLPTFFADVADFLNASDAERPVAACIRVLRAKAPIYASGWILPQAAFAQAWSVTRGSSDERLASAIERRLAEARFGLQDVLSFGVEDARQEREWDEVEYLGALRDDLWTAIRREPLAGGSYRGAADFVVRGIRVLGQEIRHRRAWPAYRKIVRTLFGIAPRGSDA